MKAARCLVMISAFLLVCLYSSALESRAQVLLTPSPDTGFFGGVDEPGGVRLLGPPTKPLPPTPLKPTTPPPTTQDIINSFTLTGNKPGSFTVNAEVKGKNQTVPMTPTNPLMGNEDHHHGPQSKPGSGPESHHDPNADRTVTIPRTGLPRVPRMPQMPGSLPPLDDSPPTIPVIPNVGDLVNLLNPPQQPEGETPQESVKKADADAARRRQEFLDSIKDYINQVNRGDGLSKDYISIGDPQVMIPKVDPFLRGVRVDPNAREPGKTSPNFDPTALVGGYKSGGDVTMQRKPADDPQTAFHEGIHCADFNAGGDGIDDAEVYSTHNIDNRLPSQVVRKARDTIDPMVDNTAYAIRNQQPSAAGRQEINRQLGLLENTVDDMRSDPTFDRALQHTGGKVDVAGYRNAIDQKLNDAANGN